LPPADARLVSIAERTHSVAEVAAIFGHEPDYVLRLIDAGELEAVRPASPQRGIANGVNLSPVRCQVLPIARFLLRLTRLPHEPSESDHQHHPIWSDADAGIGLPRHVSSVLPPPA
jgi:hypothetical protein